MKKILLYILCTNIYLPMFSQHHPETPVYEIENSLNRLAKKTPSIQYHYFEADSIIYSFSTGYANITEQRPITDCTTYHAFSVTKTFTALAVLQLAEQKKINIYEPLVSYLPDFPYGKDITIKQVLNHTSGIPNPIPISWIHLAGEHNTIDEAKYFEPIIQKHQHTKSAPNEKYRYSNIGYLYLGKLVEKASGMPYDHYVIQHIIQQLGLNNKELSFTIPELPNHAVGYHKKSSLTNLLFGFFIDKSRYMGRSVQGWKPFQPFYVNGKSYGGLIGKPSAFVTYLQELIKNDSKIISNEIKEQLFEENSTTTGDKTGMCLSWFKGMLNGQIYYAHAGGGGGYYCEIRIYPELGRGSVIFLNRSGMSDERILDTLDKAFIK